MPLSTQATELTAYSLPLKASVSSEAASLLKQGTRPEEQLQFEETIVGFFMQAADLLGVPKSIALIYGVIFASPEPLCFADVDERLDISKGSISQGIRVLKEMGAIKTVERPNDRREFFEPDIQLRQIVQRFLDQKVNRQLELGSQRLTQMREKLPKQNIHHTKILDERVSQLENWHAKTRSLMPVIKTFLKLTSIGSNT